MTIAEALLKARTNPEMKKLSYPEQQQVVKALIDKSLLTDPKFLTVPDAEKPAVYMELVKQAVTTWKPVLSNLEQDLTDEDRQLFSQNIYSDVPGSQDSYKRGLWILERLQQGD